MLDRHRGIVFKVANTYAWQREDRADLVQEIAAQLWRAWPRYDPARSVSTSVVWIGLGIGIAGLLGTWRLHRWPRQPARAPLGQRLEDSAAGGCIRKAQRVLDEIVDFERS